MFELVDDDKSQLLNYLQYVLVALIPVVVILKIMRAYVPDDDEDKYAGDKRFISHEDLQNVDLNLLPDDELTIHCAVTVYPEEED